MSLSQKLLRNRFGILAIILIIINFIVYARVIWPKYPAYQYYDGWFVFVYELKRIFLNQGFLVFSESGPFGSYAGYWHAGCPLYPLIAAGVSLVSGNVIASMILTSAIISLLGVYFLRKIAIDYMNYTNSQSFQLICIFISFNFVSEFFFVPLPISITATMPIIGTYCFLRYFHTPTLKNALFLTSVFTLVLFTRELLFPFLLIPLAVLVLLKLKIVFQHLRYELNFRHRFVALFYTTILIPCGIYSIYLFSTGTNASLFESWNRITLCPKLLTGIPTFLWIVFNTITFNWIFVTFCFILFLKVAIQYLHKRRKPTQQFATKPGNAGIVVENHDGSTGINESNLEINRLKDDLLQRNLTDYLNVTWLGLVFLSRIFLPGCTIEAYFMPVAFVLAVYVLKGTKISKDSHIQESLFWEAIVLNVFIVVSQFFDFSPFNTTDMYSFIDIWLRQEIGWPFYP